MTLLLKLSLFLLAIIPVIMQTVSFSNLYNARLIQSVDFEQGVRVHHGHQSAACLVSDVVHAHLLGDLKLVIAYLMHRYANGYLLDLFLAYLHLFRSIETCQLTQWIGYQHLLALILEHLLVSAHVSALF